MTITEAYVYAHQHDIIRGAEKLDPDFWAERHFYIPETSQPIKLEPHQRAILRLAFRRQSWDDKFPYVTVVYSTVKKSGKTALAGLVARWAAETWGNHCEIPILANDYEQSVGRIFAAVKRSIELHPDYDTQRRELPNQWRVLDKKLTHIPSGSEIRAVAADYKGEAGGNPTLSLWSELWGYDLERFRRLWDEMTPSPVRPISMRWVETYAGFEGESELLWELYEQAVTWGEQLTVTRLSELLGYDASGAFAEAAKPNDHVPIYVNESASLCAYWDTGVEARRMPWQTDESGDAYYAEQETSLRDGAYRRFHLNLWSSAEGQFVTAEQWDACKSEYATPLPAYTERKLLGADEKALAAFREEWKGKGERVPAVLAIDASVNKDSTGLCVVNRFQDRKRGQEIVIREAWEWVPPSGGKVDYDLTLTPAVLAIAAVSNVVSVCYDPFQLEHWAAQMRRKYGLVMKAFNQSSTRLLADSALHTMISQRLIHHSGSNDALNAHIANAAAKSGKDEHILRIVKKAPSRPIDLVVCISMATHECLRLNLNPR